MRRNRARICVQSTNTDTKDITKSVTYIRTAYFQNVHVLILLRKTSLTLSLREKFLRFFNTSYRLKSKNTTKPDLCQNVSYQKTWHNASIP